jgi:putative flippase GtrA
MNAVKISFLIAIAGHLLCGVCDCLLTYLPGGRFRFEDMKDNDRLSAAFRDMPLRNPLLSMLLGCLAMFLFAFGYLALADWMRASSELCAQLIRIGTVMVLTFGMAHHVFCGMPEWLYVRMGRTEEARQIITEFFRKTSVTMIICYLGFLIFGVSLFVPVVSGITPLPRWACIFNILPLMLALMPTRVGGAGNWAGAAMFLGLLFMI